MSYIANNQFIYVLDYSDGSVCKIELTSEQTADDNLDIEQLLEDKGINVNNASWMTTNNNITTFIEL